MASCLTIKFYWHQRVLPVNGWLTLGPVRTSHRISLPTFPGDAMSAPPMLLETAFTFQGPFCQRPTQRLFVLV